MPDRPEPPRHRHPAAIPVETRRPIPGPPDGEIGGDMLDVDTGPPPDRAAKGREVFQTMSAHRAVDDPAKLARAARIVRAALARRKLRLDELTPLELPERRAA